MKLLYLLFLSLLSQPIFAQSKLPVIKATSKEVTIKDGGFLDKDAWSLSPAARPDVYTADRTRETKWVVFYTDIDSIKVKVKPGTKFDFVVLLNGKDSCFTQIASAIQPGAIAKQPFTANDTIPFTLTPFNAIQVKAIINNTDTLNIHFDVGSFDFKLTKDAILKKTHLLSNQPDALAGKVLPNYNRLNKVFKIQMANIIWNNPEVGVTTFSAHDMDGRFAWNLFEGRVVEINYDDNVIVVHNALPKGLKGYNRAKLTFIRSFVCANGEFEIDGKKYSGEFLFDTGSDQAVILDSGWAAKNGFPTNLKVIKSSIMRDPRGVQYESKIVLAPGIKINHFTLTNIPTYMPGGNNPVGFEINYFGDDLLKRFNTILDFKNDMLYLKPNKLFNAAYRNNS